MHDVISEIALEIDQEILSVLEAQSFGVSDLAYIRCDRQIEANVGDLLLIIDDITRNTAVVGVYIGHQYIFNGTRLIKNLVGPVGWSYYHAKVISRFSDSVE